MTKLTKAKRIKRKSKSRNGFLYFRKIIVCSLAAFILWFIAHSVVITIDGLRDELEQVDVAIVLGNKVEVSGVPSPALKSRLDRTLELYNEGYIKNIIVSGGVGKEGHDEAYVMKGYLVNKGVPEGIVILDSEGYNTTLTAENSKVIMEERSFKTAMVISQFFHITRSKLAFKKLGIEAYGAHAKDFFFRDIYSVFREFFAYYKYLLF